MFKRKCFISLIDIDWQPIKRNINMKILPQVNDKIYFNENYYKVIEIVHKISHFQDIFIIIDLFEQKQLD